jgi:pyruvate dehydrogenase E1 component alpha subunit/2-oxoisovalerate dehydrogenase E1 component alpha subunit
VIRGEIRPLAKDDPMLGLFQIVDEQGRADRSKLPSLTKELAQKIYVGMLRIRIMDERLIGMQRQGRIGFYGEAKGQEAAVIGGAAALGPEDWLVPALRDAGGALYRGLSMRDYVSQIFGNANDVAKGHQLPCHPGTRKSKYVTMSSCIASQIPHAVGLAMAAKISGDPVVVLGCLGDGATSEPDFHVAANFAGVTKAPVVLFCMNNQWAISTPSTLQTASQTFAIKATGYGIPGIRIDGNDVLAVYATVKNAVDRARRGEGATLIEALTYRVSAHTSSDDPTRYRDERITEQWKQKDPIARYRTFLMGEKWLDEATDERLKAELDAELRDAIAAEEPVPPPSLHSLVEDVYAEVPRHLEEQFAELEQLPRQKTGGVHA